MAHRDLLEASDFLEARARLPAGWANSETEASARRGLLAAAIVYYAKSFTTNRGVQIADPKLVPKFQDEDVAAFHRSLMELRNQVVAHSDATAIPAQILDHELSEKLVIATPINHPLDGLQEDRFAQHVDECLTALRVLLHELSEDLRRLPGSLGPKIEISLMALNQESSEP